MANNKRPINQFRRTVSQLNVPLHHIKSDGFPQKIASPKSRSASNRPKTPRHEEEKLQVQLVEAFRTIVPSHLAVLYAVPNGGKRGKAEAGRLKAQGVLSGVADLVIMMRGRHVYAEVKTEEDKVRGVERTYMSTNQKNFAKQAEALGHDHHVIRSMDEWVTLLKGLGLIATR